jgi:hypothetical protein
MSLMSLTSIVGRSLFSKPILGDYELVQMMSAVAVTMALPFCQMIRGHIIVDFFTVQRAEEVQQAPATSSPACCSPSPASSSPGASRWACSICAAAATPRCCSTCPPGGAMLPMVPSFFLLGCAALYTAWVDVTGAEA